MKKVNGTNGHVLRTLQSLVLEYERHPHLLAKEKLRMGMGELLEETAGRPEHAVVEWTMESYFGDETPVQQIGSGNTSSEGDVAVIKEEEPSKTDEEIKIENNDIEVTYNGDPMLFSEALVACQQHMRAILVKKYKIRDSNALDEILQNASAGAWKYRHTFEPNKPFENWMPVVTCNEANLYLNKRKRSLMLSQIGREPKELGHEDRTVELIDEAKTCLDQLGAALRKTDQKGLLPVYECLRKGIIDSKDIAAELNLSETVVRTRKTRIKTYWNERVKPFLDENKRKEEDYTKCERLTLDQVAGLVRNDLEDVRELLSNRVSRAARIMDYNRHDKTVDVEGFAWYVSRRGSFKLLKTGDRQRVIKILGYDWDVFSESAPDHIQKVIDYG